MLPQAQFSFFIFFWELLLICNFLGTIAALQECFGNSFCCGQQLPPQLGFSKEVSSICLTVFQQQNKANFCGNQIVVELPFLHEIERSKPHITTSMSVRVRIIWGYNPNHKLPKQIVGSSIDSSDCGANNLWVSHWRTCQRLRLYLLKQRHASG